MHQTPVSANSTAWLGGEAILFIDYSVTLIKIFICNNISIFVNNLVDFSHIYKISSE